MKPNKRFTLSCLLSLALIFSGCSASTSSSDVELFDPNESIFPSGVVYETKDSGQDVVDRFVFLGESTTCHMKNREVLNGGKNTKQVWAPKSGTVCLDESIRSLRIIYPETGEELPLTEALERKRPEKILLNFGLNGVVRKYTKGSDYYQSCYKILIDLIRTHSPNTEILLSSCYPVAANMDVSHYSVDAATINSYLNTLNDWCYDLAQEERLDYLNFSSSLKDSQGFLKSNYQVGDGIHLTREAYVEVLNYIRNHN